MIAVRLTPDVRMIAVASPDYLARSGIPRSPADLSGHACINWRLQSDGRVYRWEFEKKGKRLEVTSEGPLITNQSDLGIAAALQGLGILYAFDRARVDQEVALGRLTQVLGDWSITKPGLYLYYSNRRHPQAGLGAFIDCLLDRDLPTSKRSLEAFA
jgi:DNA-binding transcriptional LysR family regulator